MRPLIESWRWPIYSHTPSPMRSLCDKKVIAPETTVIYHEANPLIADLFDHLKVCDWVSAFISYLVMLELNTPLEPHICVNWLGQHWLCSENARVCAKWQCNARDCVTGLHDQECNPVTLVEWISLSCRTYPGVLAFITYIFCPNELRWCSPNEFNTTKLLIFQIHNLFHCVAES